MNPILMAVDDGLTNNNWNAADIFFLIGLALAVISGLGYAAGVATVAHREDDTPPEGVPKTTTTTPPTTVRQHPWAAQTTWHYRLYQWAAALLAFAVGSIAFALFLQ